MHSRTMQRYTQLPLVSSPPAGIPLAFYALLLYNNVPSMVRTKVNDAWLREAR